MKTTHSQQLFLQTYAPLVGRILIGVLFLLSGLGEVGVQFQGTVAYTASSGMPMPELATVLAILIEIMGALALIFGFELVLASSALILFTLTTSLFFHSPLTWATDPNPPVQQIMFMKNLAIAGGLCYILAFGKGSTPKLKEVFRRLDRATDIGK